MPAIEIPVSCFNLEYTMLSGQPPYFLMDYCKGKAEFLSGDALVSVRQTTNGLGVEWRGGCSGEEVREIVSNRFRLKDDMKLIYWKLIRDEFMLQAVRELYGLRLTLSDPWETLACFICSVNNNLENIRRIVKALSCNLGEEFEIEGKSIYGFPDASTISESNLSSLKKCKLGFRTDYLKNAARACCDGRVDLEGIAEMSYREAKMELMRIKGVGEKVADCVLLFAYGKLEAFPVDRWVERVMKRVYRKKNEQEMREFAVDYWDGYAGYAQQYIFYRELRK